MIIKDIMSYYVKDDVSIILYKKYGKLPVGLITYILHNNLDDGTKNIIDVIDNTYLMEMHSKYSITKYDTGFYIAEKLNITENFS